MMKKRYIKPTVILVKLAARSQVLVASNNNFRFSERDGLGVYEDEGYNPDDAL